MKTNQIIRKLYLILFIIGASTSLFAQGPRARLQEKRDNIEAQKVAFITKKLNLTPEEAQQFWPVYNQFQEKIKENRKKRRVEHRDAKENFDAMSDKEVEQIVDNEMNFRQKELDIQREYHAKFKAILPIKKVAKLYEAEEQFKLYLLGELKDKARE